MLEMSNIQKDYPAEGENVKALKGITLQFRESEFVSILAPSGCGKTTLLNIIGGLDQYTSGDLITYSPELSLPGVRRKKIRLWRFARSKRRGFTWERG